MFVRLLGNLWVTCPERSRRDDMKRRFPRFLTHNKRLSVMDMR